MSKTTVLRQRNGQALIRIESEGIIPGYRGTRFEWWTDLQKMEQRIPAEGNQIYCRGYAGANQDELIKKFEEVNGIEF